MYIPIHTIDLQYALHYRLSPHIPHIHVGYTDYRLTPYTYVHTDYAHTLRHEYEHEALK